MMDISIRCPLICTGDVVLLPGGISYFQVSPDFLASKNLDVNDFEQLIQSYLIIMPGKFPSKNDLDQMEKKVGVLGKVVSVETISDDSGERITLGVKKIVRVMLKNTKFSENRITAEFELSAEGRFMVGHEDMLVNDLDVKEEALKIRTKLFDHYTSNFNSKKIPMATPDHCLPDLVMEYIKADNKQKLRILEIMDIKKRMILAYQLLDDALWKIKSSKKQTVIKYRNKSNQPRIIGISLGQIGNSKQDSLLPKPVAPEVDKLKQKLNKAGMPDDISKTVMKDYDSMKKFSSHSSDYQVMRNYLELVSDLPWSKSTIDCCDIKGAQEILERDHYSMEKVKKRILEYLAVNMLKSEIKQENENSTMRAPILCFLGPPGIGKTSIGKSIAASLGRKFHRIALGGVSNQAVIRGHRRTYVGAMCGRIIEGLKKVQVNNPVMMLDEIDKLSRNSNQGDPTAALLEVLDPEQNDSFTDSYLKLPFDLSKVLFVCTANDIGGIPRPLRDRMEFINMSGYTDKEKVVIARKYLIPKQYKVHGINSLGNVSTEITDNFISNVICHYTREAGVRGVERQIAQICRYIVLESSKRKNEDVFIKLDTKEDMVEVFGPIKYSSSERPNQMRPGVAIGMAWTAYGGVLTIVEASKTENKSGKSPSVKLTGQLGETLKESVDIAISNLLSSHDPRFKVIKENFDKYNYHIHLPAGAVKKDGPSAGITIATAIYSLLSDVAVDPKVAMTGELTLRGEVTAIGGVKNKVIAAHRYGYRVIILPTTNRGDAESELPAEVLEDCKFVYPENLTQVLEVAIPGFSSQKFLTSKL